MCIILKIYPPRRVPADSYANVIISSSHNKKKKKHFIRRYYFNFYKNRIDFPVFFFFYFNNVLCCSWMICYTIISTDLRIVLIRSNLRRFSIAYSTAITYLSILAYLLHISIRHYGNTCQLPVSPVWQCGHINFRRDLPSNNKIL